jgi:predicted TPR repeat methyltransferase
MDAENRIAKSGLKSAEKSLADQLAQERIQTLLSQSQNEWNTGNYEKTIEIFRQILKIDSKNLDAMSGIKSVRAFLKQEKKEREDLIRRAQDEHRSRRFKAAIQLWKKVMALDCENQFAKLGLKAAEKSLEKRRRKIDHLFAQAQGEEHSGKLEAAIRSWENVLKIEPENKVAKSSIEAIRKILTEEKKRDSWRQALETRRKVELQTKIKSLILQAQDEEKTGRLKKAIQTWQQVLNIAPENPIANSGLARIRDLLNHNSTWRKIDYAVKAVSMFVNQLHREKFDHGLIATFGDTFRIEQDFTSSASQLQYALERVRQSVGGMTRLYDSIEDVITRFWKYGYRDRPWLLTVITDGQDNKSKKYINNPAGIGHYVLTNFIRESDKFVFLIGVGKGNDIDAGSLATFGEVGCFPAITIDGFAVLERLFLQIALEVSEHLIGRAINIGNLSWEEISSYYQVLEVPLDYAFLIDRSTSMESPA